MWFFAVLLVLAMGGVAVVAAGKGAPLAEVYDDRPDAAVPADGPLRAEDLRRVRFSIALRGYRMSEVDALLDRLAAEREGGRADGRADEPGRGPGDGPATGAPDGGRGGQVDGQGGGHGGPPTA